jgi:O-antigen ligase
MTTTISKRLEQLISGGMLAVLVFTALAHGAVESWSLALFELAITLFLLLWAAKSVLDRRLRLTIPAPVLPLAALLMVGVAQSVSVTGASGQRAALSLDVEATRTTTLALLFLFAAALLASNFLVKEGRLRTTTNVLVVFGLMMAVFALVQHFSSEGRFYWFRPNTQSAKPFGPFANHNHFAGFMEMLALIPAGLVVNRGVRREARLLYGFAAVMMGIAIVTSLSRGGMVSLGLGLVFLAAITIRARRTEWSERTDGFARSKRLLGSASQAMAATTIVAAIVVGVLWVGSGPLVVERAAQTIDSSAIDNSQSGLAGREKVWTDTVAMIRSNPLLGVGLGAYKTAFPRYNSGNGDIVIGQAHNDFLQAISDGGIAGALIALSFVILIFRAVVRAASCGDRFLSGLAVGSGAGIFALLVHSLFDFNLQIPSNALMFLVLAAVVSRVEAIAAERISNTAVRRSREPAPATLAVGARYE